MTLSAIAKTNIVVNNRQQRQTENASAEIFKYDVDNDVSEYRVMIYARCPEDTCEQQPNAVMNAYLALLEGKIRGVVAAFKRYFLSDAANQSGMLLALITENLDCAFPIMGQPPLNKTKIALWVYSQPGIQTRVLHNGLFEVRYGTYRHLWSSNTFNRTTNSEYQTRLLLNGYTTQLTERGYRLADNCIRTWLFVQNVDANYAGVVKAHGGVFITQNLTEKAHYISSTGIGGRHADLKVSVLMDTYTVNGIKSGWVHFLYASAYLNPTYEYGVSFERDIYADYGDRRQVSISDAASINSKGEMVHPSNIREQAERMWENVGALLREADYTFNDLGQIVVYLRDIIDYTIVKEVCDKRLPATPRVFVHASVCRPGWSMEMECMGVKALENKEYAPF